MDRKEAQSILLGAHLTLQDDASNVCGFQKLTERQASYATDNRGSGGQTATTQRWRKLKITIVWPPTWKIQLWKTSDDLISTAMALP